MFTFLDFKPNCFTPFQICHSLFLRIIILIKPDAFLHSNILYVGYLINLTIQKIKVQRYKNL